MFYMMGVFDDDNIFMNSLVDKNVKIWNKIEHEYLTNFNKIPNKHDGQWKYIEINL